ncbi:MAG TPA: hypothetical protein P5287_00035 [bacterium]|nr:hypothetical protein [bacterium]
MGYIKVHFEKVVFFGALAVFIAAVIIFGGMMSRIMKASVNYFPYSDARSVKKYYIDFDRIADLIGEVKNPKDYMKFYTRDIFAEYKGEIAPQEEVKEDGETKGIKRFRLTKIFRQPVKLLFKGYMQLPDGSYTIQINWGDRTDFKAIGESIRGYKVVEFQQRMHKETLGTGVEQETNKSVIEIRKGDDKPITLELGRLVTEKELFAKLYDKKTLRNLVVYVGYEFEGYKILDITEGELVLSTETGEEFHLKAQ